MKKEYMESPLAAFCESILRQKAISEIKSKLMTSNIAIDYTNRDSINDVKFEPIFISDKPIEWQPMTIDEEVIFRAFGVFPKTSKS